MAGPDRKQLSIAKKGRIILDEWYLRYCPKYLRVIKVMEGGRTGYRPKAKVDQPTTRVRSKPKPQVVGLVKRDLPAKRERAQRPMVDDRRRARIAARVSRRKIVGRTKHTAQAATSHFQKAISELERLTPTFSNDIGVGILSFNRLDCIQRLLQSIRQHTDLNETRIFVSDESTSVTVKEWLRHQQDIVLIDNAKRKGVAGNSNRLLKCLERFKYKILLNDDVEILADGWDHFYVDALIKSGYHHFCYQQPGIYGSQGGEPIGKGILKIPQKPQGAVMAFDYKAFEAVGYFDERFNPYGMEHVDWSNRVGLSGIQPRGFFDVVGASKFFRINKHKSSMEDRATHLVKAKEFYKSVMDDHNRIKITASVDVPQIGVVIPFRGNDRLAAVKAVVYCIKNQFFPAIDIVVVEQDENCNLGTDGLLPVRVLHCHNRKPKQLFCKAMAVNMGVMSLATDHIVIHDADMLVQLDYLRRIHQLLQQYEGCHIGKDVAYLDQDASMKVGRQLKLAKDLQCERTVGYYEGGSLACRRETYKRIGGFCESFIGYGVEDCEFFQRLKKLSNFYDERTITLFHLWHGRVTGWNRHHQDNKRLGKELDRIPLETRIKEMQKKLEAWGS